MTLQDDLQSGKFSAMKILDEDLVIGKSSIDELLSQLELMQLIRISEKKIAEMKMRGMIGGPVHLGAGQEAIAVGVSKFLRNTDRVFSAHRSHAHLLALGSSPRSLFAEVLGRLTGLSKGMGGSMHLWDAPKGFYGSVPIVAGTVPLAVGAALAAKFEGCSDIGVSYFGDGAMEEGVVHESLNLASQLKIPILFVCENNLFSSHMHISQRQPLSSVSRFADANAIKNRVIDGNNIISVENAARELIDSIRDGQGPAFLEAITYRHYGHVDWNEDIDVGISRSTEELAIWRARDPILRLTNALVSLNSDLKSVIAKNWESLMTEIDCAWKLAESDPLPNSNVILDTVYTRNSQ